MARGAFPVPSMHGLDRVTVERVADRIAAVGSADTNRQLAEQFGSSETSIARLKQEGIFVALVSRKVETILHSEGKPLAIRVLMDVLRDERQRAADRIRAAEAILSRTMPPAAHAAPDGAERDLTEMSVDDLRDVVDSLKAELAERAKPADASARLNGRAADPRSVFN